MKRAILVFTLFIITACSENLTQIQDSCLKNSTFLKKAFSDKQCKCISEDITQNLDKDLLDKLNSGLKAGDVKKAVKDIKTPIAIKNALNTCVLKNSSSTKEQTEIATDFKGMVDYLISIEKDIPTETEPQTN